MPSILRAGLIATIISSAIIVVSLLVGGDGGWLFAARYTARFSFHLFLILFAVERIFAWSDAAQRAGIVAFGTAHYVHLIALGIYNLHVGIMPELGGLIGGGIFYATLGMIVVASATQRTWPRFRTFVTYAALTLFTLAYATRIPDPDSALLGYYGVAMVAVAFLCRMSARLKTPPKELGGVSGT